MNLVGRCTDCIAIAMMSLTTSPSLACDTDVQVYFSSFMTISTSVPDVTNRLLYIIYSYRYIVSCISCTNVASKYVSITS